LLSFGDGLDGDGGVGTVGADFKMFSANFLIISAICLRDVGSESSKSRASIRSAQKRKLVTVKFFMLDVNLNLVK